MVTSSQTPSIGRIVHYRIKGQDADAINRRRGDWARARSGAIDTRPPATGEQAHFGNTVREGDVFPAIIVRAWQGDLVNLQVLLDGNDVLWATSVHEGPDNGQYIWPPRV